MANNTKPLNTIVSTINTLTRTTYEQWCFKCKIELGKTLYDLVTGVTDPPDENDNEATLSAWEVVNREAMRILIPSIVEPEFQLIRNCDSAAEIWTVLKANFEDVSMLRQCNTFEQLISLKYMPDKTIHDHINSFNKLYQEIKTYKHFKELPDAIWVARFLRSLPPEYSAFARSYDKELEKTKLNDVYGSLRSEFSNRSISSVGSTSKDSSNPAANFASSSTSGKKNKGKKDSKGKGVAPAPNASTSDSTGNSKSSLNDVCGFCNKPNHTKENCYSLKWKQFYELHNPPLGRKSKSAPSGNVATYESGSAILNNTPSSPPSNHDLWVIDSGATHYMVPLDRSCFTEYTTDVPGTPIIKGINGDTPILGIGNLKLTSPKGELILRGVLHAPGLPHCILALGILMMDDVDIRFKKPYCILEKDGFYIKSKFTASFGHDSRLFRFSAPFPIAESGAASVQLPTTQHFPSELTENQINLWHARIAHVAVSGFPQISKTAIIPVSLQNAIVEQPKSGDIHPMACGPCLQGKQTRMSFPSVPQLISLLPLEVIHTDTCNISVPSIKGYKDFVTFTDQATRMSFLYYLLDKKPATVLNCFLQFKAEAELHFVNKGYKVKSIRMDGGQEYQTTLRNSNEFQVNLVNYLRNEGMHHQITAHYSPESNGISERLNRTLLEMARSMLFGAKLPAKLWPQAISASLYIKNRLPHSAISPDTTPFELWYGRKPVLSHLRVFGCAAHVHVPEEIRKRHGESKVSDWRSNRRYFVGYDSDSTHIFQVWDPSDDSFIRERNVIFDETLYFQGETLDDTDLSALEPRDSVTQEPKPPPTVSDSPPGGRIDVHGVEPDFVELHSVGSSDISDVELPSITAIPSPRSTPRSSPAPSSKQVTSTYSLRSKGPPPSPEAYLASFEALLSTFFNDIPSQYQDAINSPDRKLWEAAINEEYNSLIANNTWTLVTPPPDANIVDSRWAFDIKDESPPRYKARFVAKGYSQRYGVDYEETYAPVVKPETLRVLFAIAAARGYSIHMMDVITAFLNSILREKIYVKQPEGFVDKDHPEYVCLLNRALYGLKQSALYWYDTLRAVLESPELEFKRVESDHAVFMVRTELSTVYLALHVDDMSIFGDDALLIANIKEKLQAHFKMKDLGIMKRFVGLDVSTDGYGDISVSQKRYLERVLHRFGMETCKPASTPFPSHAQHLHKRDYDPDHPDPEGDQTLYREVVGSLNHAAVWTRPDIAYSISKLSRFLHDPSIVHVNAAKHLLRYIKGTIDLHLKFSGKGNQPPKLDGYADADYANDEDDRKSISGYCYFLFDNSSPVSYSSKSQSLVALSTMEAETTAMTDATKEGLWLRSLCYDLRLFGEHQPPTNIFMVNSDSESALKAIRNPVFHARTKHFDIRQHFVRDVVSRGDVSVDFIEGTKNPADLLTKSLEKVKHVEALRLIHMA